MERAFWSSVTINPPLYGADTPQSFFEDKLAYGWNLRNLGCLLQTHDLPSIPGG
jgi:jumonji domain-containing protein 2